MNTIVADMAMPVSGSNGTASSKTGTESGEFGEIMKSQSAQDKKNPGTTGKKEEQDKDMGHVSDNVQPNPEETTENQQILNMMLIPSMPIPQIQVGDAQAGNAEDGAIQPNQAAAVPMVDVSGAGAVKEPEVTDGSQSVADVQGEVSAMDLAGAKDKESERTVFNFHNSASADSNTVSEIPDAAVEPKGLKASVAEPEEVQENQTTDTGKVQGRQITENVRSEKDTSAYDKQDMSYMQDMTAREPAVVSESTAAGRTEAKADIRTEYMEQLKANIADSLASGKQEFEIQLNPANLGKLVIKASYEAGKAVISIVCSEARTMEAMSHQARELAAMVEDRTGNQTVVVVEHPAEDYLEQQAQQQGKQQESHPDSQQNEEKKSSFHESFDFLQQLRLGLA